MKEFHLDSGSMFAIPMWLCQEAVHFMVIASVDAMAPDDIFESKFRFLVQ